MNFPVMLALTAGMVSALNPCGFSLLPAYLGYFIDGDGSIPAERRIVRAAESSMLVTAGFVLVFLIFGLLVDSLLDPIRRQLPWITALLGIVVIVVGVIAMTGRRIALPSLALSGTGNRRSLDTIAFGMIYALASFSCTIGPFVAVTAVALDRSPLAGMVSFVAYGMGMGVVITALAIASSLARPGITGSLRRISRFSGRVGGSLMVLSGSYTLWYARWELAVYAGDLSRDPVVDNGERVRLWVTDLLRSAGVSALAAIVLTIVMIAAAWAGFRSVRSSKVVQ